MATTEHYTYREPQHGDYVRYEAQRRPASAAFDTTSTRNYPYDTSNNSVSASKVVAVMTLLPLGGTLLVLSGLTLAATVIGLALASPLFVIFSPVLVPAALAIVLAVAGFISSGAFGVTAVSALTWMAQYVRRIVWEVAPEARDELEYLRRRGQDTVDYIGQKTKDAGQAIQNKAHDLDRDDLAAGARGGQQQHYEGAKGGRDRDRETVSVKTHETTKTHEGGKNK